MIKTSAITNTVEIIPSILLTIINLFADTSVLTSLSMSVQEKAPIVFAYLITDSESLQKAAMEGDAILKLSGLVADCIKEQNSYLNIEPIIASPVVSNQINRGRIESISNINAPNTSSLNNDSSESERKIAANSTTFHTETVLEVLHHFLICCMNIFNILYIELLYRTCSCLFIKRGLQKTSNRSQVNSTHDIIPCTSQ